MSVPKLRFKEFDGDWNKNSIQYFMDTNFILDQMDGNHGELYPKSEEFSSTGVPYISATDFSFGDVNFAKCKRLPIERAKLFKKGIAKNGDVLFAHNATVGPVAILKTDLDFVILSTTATYYRCDTANLSNHYLKNYFESDFFVQQYFGIMSQSTRNQVPITTQRKLNIAVPNIQEQTKIASFLSAVDEKISQLTQKHELLSQYKQGMMQKLFSQQIRFKADDGSEFGEWEEKPLKNIAKIYDGTHQTPNYVEEGVPFYSVEHVTANNFSKTKFIAEDVFLDELKRVQLEKNDILLTRIGDIGTSKLIDWDVRASFYVSLALIKVDKKHNSSFVNQYIKSVFFQRELHERTIHVAFPKKINLGEIGLCLIRLPCLEEQTKIANFLSAIDQKIEVVAQQIEQAKQWKKGLLQQMFV
ncbi:restriction endonuclease subunit S [Acinetobacter towneri]|uniref:restriction endonuclease subunit S n=1 Tax=Acinetobacter towneri TaxID=202956 RepID=UPI00209781CF|nr:restriction endonuclease subunit S [Acinetobacter towneri]MCO8060065.1 restriction endonuclease subunit S [Acinetobacter towneri]MCO8065715.1 restriction endonuclease subunit S [Acinetobacter towneri]